MDFVRKTGAEQAKLEKYKNKREEKKKIGSRGAPFVSKGSIHA